jgi:PEP-CTERM motif-containing protein
VISGLVPNFLEFVLIDFDGTMLDSDALPLVPPSLVPAEIADLEILFVNTAGVFVASIVGDLTSFELGSTSVPEPVSFSLLGVGLAGLGWARRRKS